MLAIAYASLMGLLRDRGALVMAFVLPALIFVIFAAVFSGTQGDDLEITAVFSDATQSEAGTALGAALREADALVFAEGGAPGDGLSMADARRRVAQGAADAAILVVADPATAAGPRSGQVPPPVLIVADDAKPLAGALASAAARQALAVAVPGAVGPPRVTVETTVADSERDPAVTYYAGAIAIMFLFFSALQSAVALIEDRESGIVDRLMLSRGGIGAMIAGKYVFLVGLGLVQALTVFAVAWVGYGVEFWRLPEVFAMTTLLAAMASAGLALAVVAPARTRAQALATGNAIVLIISAIGGSMVPRYMMPQWLQDLGALTPSAWVIEAYQAALWRDLAEGQLELLWALLGLFSLLCLVFSWTAMRLRERAA